jgi:hypothetical protein
MNTVAGPALGGYGGRFSYPVAGSGEGKEWDLSRMGPNEGKYYFKLKGEQNRAEVYRNTKGVLREWIMSLAECAQQVERLARTPITL